MIIPIPYGMEYTATVEGRVFKFVRCEKCNSEFAYEMKREGSGSGTAILFVKNQGARERASAKAQAELSSRLQNECDPVPCPECGCYQEHMIPVIRRNFQFWMTVSGLFLLLGGFILFLWFVGAGLSGDPSNNAWAGLYGKIAAALGGAGVAFLLLRYLWARTLKPNVGDPEIRKQLGQKLTLDWREFARVRREMEEEGTLTRGEQ